MELPLWVSFSVAEAVTLLLMLIAQLGDGSAGVPRFDEGFAIIDVVCVVIWSRNVMSERGTAADDLLVYIVG